MLTVADLDELAQAAEHVHGDYGPTMGAPTGPPRPAFAMNAWLAKAKFPVNRQ
jgi:hypothetical protein